MLDDRPAGEPIAPQLGALALLHPGGHHGLDAHTMVMVVDTVDTPEGAVVVWHLPDHPDYWDWAATITAADVASIISTDPDPYAVPPPHTEDTP
ncbi:DUF6211 family protein [Streptomyces sp. NPDC005900]|uniref:DUF6211 family protein n=1 Tax=Streptomyces sp. NPDC005900 TaxID=3154569 RepID=UPI0033E96D67